MSEPQPGAALLARAAGILAKCGGGLSLTDLRIALDTSTDELRPVLEAGIRAKTIRRIGSHSTLRYLVNQ